MKMRAWLTEISLRIKALFRKKRLDRDLDEEMSFHLAMLEEANRTRGVNSAEARREVNRRFGNVTRMKELCREAWSFVWLETTWRDPRFGARTLSVGNRR